MRLGPALASAALACAPVVHAVDTPEPAPQHLSARADRLVEARTHIAAQRWSQAIEALTLVDDRASADWNNLMGFAHRRRRPPDLEAAQRYYDAALAIDAQHRGALEYSGELYLMKGDLTRAEQRLAQLARACASACEEHADLQRAIARFRSC
jgi:tetratricopeptide (TPR) repeat protein